MSARSVAPPETQTLYGVPAFPATCFLLSDAQADLGEELVPVARLAIAVTHLLNGVPGVPATWVLLSLRQ